MSADGVIKKLTGVFVGFMAILFGLTTLISGFRAVGMIMLSGGESFMIGQGVGALVITILMGALTRSMYRWANKQLFPVGSDVKPSKAKNG